MDRHTTAHQRWLELGGADAPLSLEDVAELSIGTMRVLALLRDCEWHDAEEIREAAQGAEGTRRLRELRKYLRIVKDKTTRADGSPSRMFKYRLVKGSKPAELTGTLFERSDR